MSSNRVGKSALALAAACLLVPGAVEAGPLGAAGEYGEFVFGDLTRTKASSGGAVAAGGSAVFHGMTIGGAEKTGLVIGGDLAWKSGRLESGMAYVGGSASTRGVKTPEGIEQKMGETPIDFKATQSYLEAFSRAQYGDPNAKVHDDGHRQLTFGSEDAGDLQVVDVDASDLKGMGLRVAGAEGSTVIVNVAGEPATFKNLKVELTGGIAASNVLWNFMDATSLSLSGVSWVGTILATAATVDFNNGRLTGSLIASALSGNGAIDVDGGAALFAGDARSVATTPEPASIAMMAASMAAALGTAALRRRRRGLRERASR